MALHGPDRPALQEVLGRPVLRRGERLQGLSSRQSLPRATRGCRHEPLIRLPGRNIQQRYPDALHTMSTRLCLRHYVGAAGRVRRWNLLHGRVDCMCRLPLEPSMSIPQLTFPLSCLSSVSSWRADVHTVSSRERVRRQEVGTTSLCSWLLCRYAR